MKYRYLFLLYVASLGQLLGSATASIVAPAPDPVVPPEQWTINFEKECWRVKSRYYYDGNPIQPTITYVPCAQVPSEMQEILTDMKPFVPAVGGGEEESVTMRSMRGMLAMIRFGKGGPPIAGWRVIYNDATKTLFEWWTDRSNARLVEYDDYWHGIGHGITLLKYDPSRAEKYHHPEGLFCLTYRIPNTNMSEKAKARWIERLKNAELR